MSFVGCLIFLLLVQCSIFCGEARNFRLAIALFGEMSDFAWTFHNNIARIAVVETLMDMYPDINVTHEYAFLPQSFSKECHPQFEAWCRSGVDLIIATDVGSQVCLAHLAGLYPNVTLINDIGSIAGPPNYANAWVRLYQPIYLAGYTAGLVTKTKKVCVAAMAPIPTAILDAGSFFRGVHNADPTVHIHVFSTGHIVYPLLETWIVNQSHALGCDVVWVYSTDGSATKWATELGLMAIGFLSDARMTMGDNIITSVIVDMVPVYLRAAKAVLNGTFQLETRKADWWMGWDWGVINIGQFSFLVPKDIRARVLAQIPTVDRVWCGRVCTQTQCLCNESSCCLKDSQLFSMDSWPDFIDYHGIVQLPGLACNAGQFAKYNLDTFTMECTNCPAGTYAYNADETSECRPCPPATYSLPGSSTCPKCPAGTHSDQPGSPSCTPCPVGSIAANPGTADCNLCPSGISNAAGTQCGQPSLWWLAGVGGGVGGVVLIGVLLLWWTQTHSKRNNRAAPKDTSQPFCIFFTDIQSSTALWASIPDVMASAVDDHHRLIRKLIAKHHCYEVKTIGDSFMCVSKSPSDAVCFSLALQQEFALHDWGTDSIEHVYAELLGEEIVTPGCWNGLRVRVGIHYGRGDIKLDPVSQGYDYYGTVVNTAARIESVCHGGQIVVSEAVFEAVRGHFLEDEFSDLGMQPLRGLVEPLHLYQVLLPGTLSQRQFPPLRIDCEGEKVTLVQAVQEAPFVVRPTDKNRVYPVGSCGIPTSHRQWVEKHALVLQGDVDPEDLWRQYHTLQVGLATLLAALERTPKREVVRELCAHLRVPNFGASKEHLFQTLHGLIHCILPATVKQVLEQRPRAVPLPRTQTAHWSITKLDVWR